MGEVMRKTFPRDLVVRSHDETLLRIEEGRQAARRDEALPIISESQPEVGNHAFRAVRNGRRPPV